MFARRKSTLGCDDALVPHGFVGQAIVEFMSPRNAESAQPDLPGSGANQIPMPRFRRGPEQPDTAVRRGPASVPAEEIRANSVTARPSVTPAPGPSLLPPVQELNKLRMLLQEERAKGAQRHVEPVRATSVAIPPSRKLIEHAASVVTETAPEPASISTPQPEPAPIQPDPMWFQSRLESAKRIATTFVVEIKRRWLGAGAFAQQFWTRRVRIRLAARVPLQKIISGPMSACRTAVNAVRRNARLVNSLAMATLSALLAWGLIAAVRHYDPADMAAGHGATPSSLSADSAPVNARSAPTAPATPVVAKDVDSGARRNQARAASHTSAKPTPVVQAADRKTIRRQAHRSGDDDYVAPDTYVYYGKR